MGDAEYDIEPCQKLAQQLYIRYSTIVFAGSSPADPFILAVEKTDRSV